MVEIGNASYSSVIQVIKISTSFGVVSKIRLPVCKWIFCISVVGIPELPHRGRFQDTKYSNTNKIKRIN